MTGRGTYICNDPHHSCGASHFNGSHQDDHHCWHESTARRIAQQGGPSANAAADLAAWNALGQRRKVAA